MDPLPPPHYPASLTSEPHHRQRISRVSIASKATNTSDIEASKQHRRITLSTIANILERRERDSRECSGSVTGIRPHRRITLSTISTAPDRLSQDTQTTFDRGTSQWEVLMRKFSQDCKRMEYQCQNRIQDDLTCEVRAKKTFTTGSAYEGTWDALGLCGYGRYTFPNGVVYEGEFEDNAFHGDGELRYPDGTIIKGKWNSGEIIERTIIFADGVQYQDENWNYCKPPDRRFAREFYEGIQPAGASFITSQQPPAKIPEGMYDAGDGIFDPRSETIYDYDDLSTVVRIPDTEIAAWIMENCRKNPDEPVGPLPSFYPEWKPPELAPEEPPEPTCVAWADDDDLSIASVFSDDVPATTWRHQFQPGESSSIRKFRYDPDRTSVLDSFRPDHSNIASKDGQSGIASLITGSTCQHLTPPSGTPKVRSRTRAEKIEEADEPTASDSDHKNQN